MTEPWYVHLAGWQKIAWALDEDLNWVRTSLDGFCQWVAMPFARIVHAAWPPAIEAIPEPALRGKTVVCQADNPPSFYLAAGNFSDVATKVDLWIARSAEALSQFHALGLPARLVPYAVDPGVFRPLNNRAEMRHSLGIPRHAFVVGNFHRDSEASDLTKPKKQKGPDLFLEIVRRLHAQIPSTVVLLAGPRRHWLLGALRASGIPVVFAGEDPGARDDYDRNILPRERLNSLYQALDVCLVSSRWEGGPYSVLEALAAGSVVVSSRVGIARDVLPSECLFSEIEQAVEILVAHARTGCLKEFCRGAAARAAVQHGPEAIKEAYAAIYRSLPHGKASLTQAVRSGFANLSSRMKNRFCSPASVGASWSQEVESAAAENRDHAGLIEYPCEASRAALMQTAARIRAARLAS